ncbi:MAG: DUF3311 domain-containing protein [Thermoplasmata archaeon]
MNQEKSKNITKKYVKIIVTVLTVIPFLFLLIVPSYNITNPTLSGLPFFYWYQIMWLFLAAMLFSVAALIYNKYGGE